MRARGKEAAAARLLLGVFVRVSAATYGAHHCGLCRCVCAAPWRCGWMLGRKRRARVAAARQILLLFYMLPGVYFALSTTFVFPLHLEHEYVPFRALVAGCEQVHTHRHLGVLKSISASVRVFNRYFCNMLGFVLLLVLLQVCGRATPRAHLRTLPAVRSWGCSCLGRESLPRCPWPGARSASATTTWWGPRAAPWRPHCNRVRTAVNQR